MVFFLSFSSFVFKSGGLNRILTLLKDQNLLMCLAFLLVISETFQWWSQRKKNNNSPDGVELKATYLFGIYQSNAFDEIQKRIQFAPEIKSFFVSVYQFRNVFNEWDRKGSGSSSSNRIKNALGVKLNLRICRFIQFAIFDVQPNTDWVQLLNLLTPINAVIGFSFWYSMWQRFTLVFFFPRWIRFVVSFCW